MSFSPSQAALEGFRLIGRRPVTMVIWSLVLVVFCAAIVALFLGVAWNALVEIDRVKGDTFPPAEAFRLFGPIAGAVAVAFPFSLLLNGVLLAALFRAVLKPEKVGFGYLRLGADELRQIAVALLHVLLSLVFVAGPIIAIVCLRLTYPFTPVHWAGAVLGDLGALLIYLWVGVRLSLAGPMTQAAGRVRFLKSWSLTRGRFWELLGMYLLAFVLACVVYFVGSMLADAALAALDGGGRFAYSGHHLPDLAEVSPRLWIGLAVYFALQMVLSTLQFAVVYAPQAAAYRDLAQAGV